VATLSDAFNRADNSSSLGTADTGQTWTALNGTWGIDTNKARNYSPGTQAFATVDTGSANITAQLVVTGGTSSGGGITFRAVDLNNLWFTECDSGQMLLYRVQSGSYTQIITGMPAVSSGDVIQVITQGNLITIFRNGSQVGQTTQSFNNTATKHGLRDYGGAIRLDDFTLDNETVILRMQQARSRRATFMRATN